jgi:hypothetical protein
MYERGAAVYADLYRALAPMFIARMALDGSGPAPQQ